MQDLLPIIVLTTGTIAIAWIISLIIAALRHRSHLRAQTDFHNRMMEKFSTAEEFTAYLQSDAGKSFFENLATEPISSPTRKILGSIQKGAILTLLGLGLFSMGNYFPGDQGNILIIFGVISFTVGAGFLVSSFISYRLAKAWELIPDVRKNGVK